MTDASLRQEIRALLDTYESRPLHALHVARLAQQLFCELAPLHGLGERQGLLLEAAALLHDVGRATQKLGGEHHKESARLIREHPWRGFTPAEVEIIALVARYHRKSPPDLSHAEFAVLSPMDQWIVTTLAALLRLADGLDRTHRQLIEGLRAEISPQEVTLYLAGSPDALEELVAARRKAELAEKVFGRRFRFLLPDPDSASREPTFDRPAGQGPVQGPRPPAD